jgi:error-prone DNA polymerase
MAESIAYTGIHLRSYFSLCQGCLSPEEICRYARNQGWPAAGMTDLNNFYGLVRFLNAARREGVKPVAGVVLASGAGELATAYIRNRRGFVRLAEIITNLKNQDPLDNLLERGWPGLVILSDNTSVLQQLLQHSARGGCNPSMRSAGTVRSAEGLWVKLTYGRPFSGLVRFARTHKLPLCAVNDAFYIEEGDEYICNLLRAMSRNTLLEYLSPEERVGRWHRVVSAVEMERFFSAVPEALDRARVLVQESDTGSILSSTYVFPRFSGNSEQESLRELKALCLAGAERRYSGVSIAVKARLDHELSIIRRKGFAGYFLVVHDIVSRCARTCGRGSSAASIVSYLLGITHVDPLRYNLFFERFLNLERSDPPDIDVDFPWDEREKALRYVFDRYAGRAGMVADHVTFRERSALREPAKALGSTEEEIKRFIYFARHGQRHKIPVYLGRIASRILGFPRYLGTHPGGVVITPGPLTNYTHFQQSPLGYPVIAWEKDGTEEAGLVKIDLLGNRSLSVLRDTIELTNHNHQTNLSWENFNPLKSQATRNFIARARTLGVFYVESPATRQLLKKMQRGDYENLVIASSIIRPAANRYIREFVRRLHGAGYEPLHPLLAETLRETFGIMVYQEDVSRVAISLAGFSPGQADRLRKILSKKNRKLRLSAIRENFFAGGKSKGISVSVLERVWEMILSFDGYSFCKAHSASYALVSYKLAYLKLFYPLEFFVSVINNGGGYYSRQTYINECRRLGFDILIPDINKSSSRYTVENGAMRIGLGQLKDLSAEFMKKILDRREQGGLFEDFYDFLQRTSPRLAEVRILIRSGSLDSISGGLTRPQLFWAFFRLDKGNTLFRYPPIPRSIGDYTEPCKLLDQVRTLGLLVSLHPLSLFRRRIALVVIQTKAVRFISSREIPRHINRRVTLAGLWVTGKEVVTRNRESMVFVSFEDRYSIFETVFFPASFNRFSPLINGGGVFILSGKVEEDSGSYSVNVDKLIRVETGQQ